MNITFWILMILMLLLAIGLLVYPLLKTRQQTSLAYKDSNLKINDEKIKELDLDLKEGRIDQDFYKAAREELDRELLIDIPAESKETVSLQNVDAARSHSTLALVIAVFVPVLVLLIYLDLGMPETSEQSFAANAQPAQKEEVPSIDEMARQLEERLSKDGGTVEDWIMLGRAHKFLGDNGQAAKAFAVALEQDENNAQLMLETAEVLALDNNRVFADDARALVLKAHALEPDNANTLWFAGVAEYQYENYHEAIAHLTKLLPAVTGEEEIANSIKAIVIKSRQALIAAGEEVPELEMLLAQHGQPAKAEKTEMAAVSQPSVNDSSVASLQVSVNVSDQIRARFKASDVVFVYAKAKQGPRMPLAAQRVTLSDLPITILLDDSMAMVEGMNMSAFNELVVSARVSRSGSAIAQSGDYIGQRDVSGDGMNGAISIEIDRAVP